MLSTICSHGGSASWSSPTRQAKRLEPARSGLGVCCWGKEVCRCPTWQHNRHRIGSRHSYTVCPRGKQRRHLPSLIGSTGCPSFGRPCTVSRPPLDVSLPLGIPRATISTYVEGRRLLFSGVEVEAMADLGKGPEVGALVVCDNCMCTAWVAGGGPRGLLATSPRMPISRFASTSISRLASISVLSHLRVTLDRWGPCADLLATLFGRLEFRPQVGQQGFPG